MNGAEDYEFLRRLRHHDQMGKARRPTLSSSADDLKSFPA